MRPAILFSALFVLSATPAISANSSEIDKEFATTLAQGGMAEVQAGKLAASIASDASVKAFGEQMAADHGKANTKFEGIAKQENVALPTETDPDHEAALNKLSAAEGKNFDSEYMKAQVLDHQKTVELLQREIDSGQNAAFKSFASEVLPTVQSHLKMAQEIAGKLGN